MTANRVDDDRVEEADSVDDTHERTAGENRDSDGERLRCHRSIVDPRQWRLTSGLTAVGGATALAGCNVDVEPAIPQEDDGSDDDDSEGDDDAERTDEVDGAGSDAPGVGATPTDTISHGSGTLAVHDGAFVIGDSSPSQITSQGPDEVRSQIPFHAPAFHTTSARAAKTDVEPVDPERILERIESLSISRWRFVGADDEAHVGPMAEDFQDAFDLEGDGETIATVDADGVVFAALVGVARRLRRRNERLRNELKGLDERLEKLAARIEAHPAT